MKKGKWIVHIKGFETHSDGMVCGELCVIRDSNDHGKESWGWNNPNEKVVLIDNVVSKRVWDNFSIAAQSLADALNKVEKHG